MLSNMTLSANDSEDDLSDIDSSKWNWTQVVDLTFS